MDGHLAFKNMLLELSALIDDGDLDRMKFRCDTIVKKAESQKIKDSIQLFIALEQREYLGYQNTEFLKELLRTCCRGKLDGQRLVEQYERGVYQGAVSQGGLHQGGVSSQPPPVVPPTPGSTNGVVSQPQVVYVVQGNQRSNLPEGVLRENNRPRYMGPDLSREIGFLCTKLGKDWRFFIRALGVGEEEIEQASQDYPSVKEKVCQCLYLWQQQEQQGANKQKLIDALRYKTLVRNDLAMILEDGDY